MMGWWGNEPFEEVLIVRNISFLFCLVFAQVAFGSDELRLGNERPAILEVFGDPVGIRSVYQFEKCHIQVGVLPMNVIRISLGESFDIPVVGGRDVVLRCEGDRGIVISRR